jgi:hypothetical protein
LKLLVFMCGDELFEFLGGFVEQTFGTGAVKSKPGTAKTSLVKNFLLY